MEIKLQFNSRLNMRNSIHLHPSHSAEIIISAEEVLNVKTAEEAEVKTREAMQGFKRYIKSLQDSLNTSE